MSIPIFDSALWPERQGTKFLLVLLTTAIKSEESQCQNADIVLLTTAKKLFGITETVVCCSFSVLKVDCHTEHVRVQFLRLVHGLVETSLVATQLQVGNSCIKPFNQLLCEELCTTNIKLTPFGNDGHGSDDVRQQNLITHVIDFGFNPAADRVAPESTCGPHAASQSLVLHRILLSALQSPGARGGARA